MTRERMIQIRNAFCSGEEDDSSNFEVREIYDLALQKLNEREAARKKVAKRRRQLKSTRKTKA